LSRKNHDDSPYRDAPAHATAPPATRAARKSRRAAQQTPQAKKSSSSLRRSSRRSRNGKAHNGRPQHAHPKLTSLPTHRGALAATRSWLLAQHGPVCAYCNGRFEAGVMTLDHVAPRRGQTAYDRRDNLVLACPACNAAKRDMAPLAFLLARRSRAAHLLRFGSHLSPMLVELARSLVQGNGATNGNGAANGNGASHRPIDEDSPYLD
jgi:5-methylcytosine-specific restriction endonuclease McrA